MIGGAAAQARGWPEPTDDIDFTPSARRATCRAWPPPWKSSTRGFAWTRPATQRATGHQTASTGARFATRSQSLSRRATETFDVVLLPDGTNGYEEIIATATREMLPGTAIVVPVASAEMILHSKGVADRPKDHAVLDRMRDALGLGG